MSFRLIGLSSLLQRHLLDNGKRRPPYAILSASFFRSCQLENVSLDPNKKETPQHDNIDLTFTDCQKAHASKTNWELLRAYFVFQMCSINFLVENNKQVLKIARTILGQRLFRGVMRATFYGHFVAGEDQEDIKPLILRNRQYGVKSILDYSVEEELDEEEAVAKVKEGLSVVVDPAARPDAASPKFQTSLEFADRSDKVTSARTYFYESEQQCDKNMETFLHCIDAVSGSTQKEGFAAIKLTALGRPELLLQLSDFLVQIQNLYRIMANSDVELPQEMKFIDKASIEATLRELNVEIVYNADKKITTSTRKLARVSRNAPSGKFMTYAYESFEKQPPDMLPDFRKEDLLQWSNMLQFENNLARVCSVKNVKTNTQVQLVPTLTEEGLEEMRNMIYRIDRIAKHAKENEVRVMVDAEQSYFQPAIRRLVMEMMRRFNQERAVIFNTYQCYLKDSLIHVSEDLQLSEREDFYFGAKMVRGAYVDQEKQRAIQLNYRDPINDTYDATTAMYNNVLEEIFENINKRPKGRIAVMVATHNEASVRHAVESMAKHNITRGDRLICFGQLLGMCDQISFALGQAGFSVYKYIPYGPIEEVLPYLSRRAFENRGMLAKVVKERRMLLQEMKRRFLAREWGRIPPKLPS